MCVCERNCVYVSSRVRVPSTKVVVTIFFFYTQVVVMIFFFKKKSYVSLRVSMPSTTCVYVCMCVCV